MAMIFLHENPKRFEASERSLRGAMIGLLAIALLALSFWLVDALSDMGAQLRCSIGDHRLCDAPPAAGEDHTPRPQPPP